MCPTTLEKPFFLLDISLDGKCLLPHLFFDRTNQIMFKESFGESLNSSLRHLHVDLEKQQVDTWMLQELVSGL